MADGKVTIRVSLDEALAKSLGRLAAQSGDSRSEVITQACERFVAARAPVKTDDEKVLAYVEGYRRLPESAGAANVAAFLASEVLEIERSSEEAIKLTRAFIEANRDWLHAGKSEK